MSMKVLHFTCLWIDSFNAGVKCAASNFTKSIEAAMVVKARSNDRFVEGDDFAPKLGQDFGQRFDRQAAVALRQCGVGDALGSNCID